MNPRSDIPKCLGEDNPLREQCTRKLAPAAPLNQRWVQPIEDLQGQCVLFFPLAIYGVLYGAAAK